MLLRLSQGATGFKPPRTIEKTKPAGPTIQLILPPAVVNASNNENVENVGKRSNPLDLTSNDKHRPKKMKQQLLAPLPEVATSPDAIVPLPPSNKKPKRKKPRTSQEKEATTMEQSWFKQNHMESRDEEDLQASNDNSSDPDQKAAIEYTTDKPLMILAGPGSGKTSTLTLRVKHMLEHNVAPNSIIIFTLTNRAAASMRQRLQQMIDPSISIGVTVSTFHAFCLTVLRDSELLRPETSILQDDDQLMIVKEAYKRYHAQRALEVLTDQNKMQQTKRRKIQSPSNDFTRASDMYAEEKQKDEKKREKKKINEILDLIRLAQVYRRGPGSQFSPHELECFVYEEYERYKANTSSVDFSDMLNLTLTAMEERRDIVENYSHRFKYVLVDEYQDTNTVQLGILQILASHGRITVVGDINQSIYGWRGAASGNWEQFLSHFKDCETVSLKTNYRSTKSIVHSCNRLLNVVREGQSLGSDSNCNTPNVMGEVVSLSGCYNKFMEAGYVASEFSLRFPQLLNRTDTIDLMLKDTEKFPGLRLSDFAVLYRNNSISWAFQRSLMEKQLHFRVAGGNDALNVSINRIMTSYLRIMSNGSDNLSLLKIMNVPPRGLGDKATVTLQDQINIAMGKRRENNRVSAVEMILSWRTKPIGLNGGQFKNLRDLAEKLKRWNRTMGNVDKPSAAVHRIVKDTQWQLSSFEESSLKFLCKSMDDLPHPEGATSMDRIRMFLDKSSLEEEGLIHEEPPDA
ncbi:ATP-dependent DNA helicase PcrA, partial [Planoprotostelium fungivorum]